MRKLWLSSTSVPVFMAVVRAKAAWAKTIPAMALDEVITTTKAAATIIRRILRTGRSQGGPDRRAA